MTQNNKTFPIPSDTTCSRMDLCFRQKGWNDRKYSVHRKSLFFLTAIYICSTRAFMIDKASPLVSMRKTIRVGQIQREFFGRRETSSTTSMPLHMSTGKGAGNADEEERRKKKNETMENRDESSKMDVHDVNGKELCVALVSRTEELMALPLITRE